MNDLRYKAESGKRICGTLVSLAEPCMCEIMGNLGYDCVWIDMEHTYMSCKDVLCHLNASKASGIPAVVRLPQNDLTVTKKILEMGPDGIIFPMVRSADEVNRLIEMTLYPPLGTRGFGPMRAIGYGAYDAKEYADKQSLDLLRFIQIEHIDLINEIEEVIKNPYIDGFIFGPNDLSASLNEFLNVFGAKTFSEVKRVTEFLKRKGKLVGLACGANEADVKKWSEIGFDMLFAGADWNFIYNCGKTNLEVMRKHFCDCKGV